jgi:ElaB/YqjD/DUF883 family membrane-anchored ribosome-binding protein
MTKSNSEAESSPDLQTVMNDVSALKGDLAALVRNMKSDVYDNLAATGERSVKAIGSQVEKRPILSLLIAFAVGFVGSRLLSR